MGNSPWATDDGTLEQAVERFRKLSNEGSLQAFALGAIDGLLSAESRPLAWRVERARMVLAAFDQVTEERIAAYRQAAEATDA